MRLHLSIAGRVQGVSYRATFAAQARALSLCGWVRNRRDGSVEAIVAGAPNKVEHLRSWAEKGPPLARVDEIQATLVATTDALDNAFVIAPTE